MRGPRQRALARLIGSLIGAWGALGASGLTALGGGEAVAAGLSEPEATSWVAGVDPPRGAAQGLNEGEPITALGPLRLRRAPADATLVRLAEEAEAAYRARDLAAAHEGYRQLVSLMPAHAGAWFRLGTIHQQSGELQAATDAYRRALSVLAAEGEDGDPSLRARALLNLALIGQWRARLALAELDRQPNDPSLEQQRLQIGRDLQATEARLQTLGRRWPQDVIIERPGQASTRARQARTARVGETVGAPTRAGPTTIKPVDSAPAVTAPIEVGTSRSKVEHLQGMPGRTATPVGASAPSTDGVVPRQGARPPVVAATDGDSMAVRGEGDHHVAAAR